MTYGELSNTKTFGFETNHIIDDAVNNARFSYGKKFWESEVVSDHDLNQINQFAKREGVSFPPSSVGVEMTNSEQLAEKIKSHLMNGGAVRFATCYTMMILKAKHADLVSGSKSVQKINGVYVTSGNRKTFWMESYIRFSK